MGSLWTHWMFFKLSPLPGQTGELESEVGQGGKGEMKISDAATLWVYSLSYCSSSVVRRKCEWDPGILSFLSLTPCLSPSTPLPGWAGEGQHGEADVLCPVSSREAGPYRSLPVGEIVKGRGSTQIWVSITSCLPNSADGRKGSVFSNLKSLSWQILHVHLTHTSLNFIF